MKREININNAIYMSVDCGDQYCCRCKIHKEGKCGIFGDLEFDIWRHKRHNECIKNEIPKVEDIFILH